MNKEMAVTIYDVRNPIEIHRFRDCFTNGNAMEMGESLFLDRILWWESEDMTHSLYGMAIFE